MKKIKLTQEKHALVDDCDYETISQWKWCYHKGAAARNEKNNGKNKYILMHRFILNAKKGEIIDHIDGNPLNNTRINIRICTQSQNMMNKRIKTNKKSSIYKGVFFDKRRNHYVAEIKKRDNRIYIGSYKNEIEAAMAYDGLAKEIYGEFARTNLREGVL